MEIYNHNQICTTGKRVDVDKQYCYYEDGMACEVTVFEDNSDDEGIRLKLGIVAAPPKSLFKVGYTFEVFACAGRYAYWGMWRLYDSGEYCWRRP